MQYLGERTVETDNRVELIARVRVDGDRVFEPRLNKYRLNGQTLGTPSVRVGPGQRRLPRAHQGTGLRDR